MKVRISNVSQVEQETPVIEDLEETLEEVIEKEPEMEPEDQVEEDYEEDDSDFQYDNDGIYFKNGIEILFNKNYDKLSISSIKDSNGKVIEIECDDEGHINAVKVLSEEIDVYQASEE